MAKIPVDRVGKVQNETQPLGCRYGPPTRPFQTIRNGANQRPFAFREDMMGLHRMGTCRSPHLDSGKWIPQPSAIRNGAERLNVRKSNCSSGVREPRPVWGLAL